MWHAMHFASMLLLHICVCSFFRSFFSHCSSRSKRAIYDRGITFSSLTILSYPCLVRSMYNKYEALCPLMLNKGQKCSQFRGICATFEPKKPFFPNQHLTHGAKQGARFKFDSSKGILWPLTFTSGHGSRHFL